MVKKSAPKKAVKAMTSKDARVSYHCATHKNSRFYSVYDHERKRHKDMTLPRIYLKCLG